MRMRALLWLGLAMTLVTGTGWAQNFLPTKDLIFGQVAAGPGFETVINLTNRGTYAYAGALRFRRGDAVVWKPSVTINGTPVTPVDTDTQEPGPLDYGKYPLTIQPDETLTVRVNEAILRSGMALLLGDLYLDNFVEATLTYYVRSGGKLVDSVGVSPSTEFYLAALPFDDFKTIALALANGDLYRTAPTTVRIDLLTEDGNLLATEQIDLAPFAHQAKFLKEIFPGLDLARGKVEIFSFAPVFGTALTLVNGQLSSLPLKPSPIAYTIRMVSQGGRVLEGDLSLWAEDYFVKGYLVISRVDGTDINTAFALVSGELTDGLLKLSCFDRGEAFYNEDVQIQFQHSQFDFAASPVAGTWVLTYASDNALDTGTFELNRTTP